MKRGLQTTLLKRVHSSTERLQCAVDNHSYLLTSAFEPLPDAAKKPSVPKLPYALSNDLSSQLNDLNSNQASAETTPPPRPLSQPPQETYHEMMRRQSRRLQSWPSREFDAFREEGGGGSLELLRQMRALESTAAPSLATYASLLIKFMARFDYLVESVDKLARLAEFKHKGLQEILCSKS
ncbi:hypothetical protein Nepgr_028556 [Nepenthes gracilis]|uniref:Uncharacterized protein n=1 Tax=Nepenthes gracilis TaxID=150966 RepID=A0AAD3Y2I4_NEPGR|nr:hypothetical protein Nepgr_028556 [Nepenthes gracilis]